MRPGGRAAHELTSFHPIDFLGDPAARTALKGFQRVQLEHLLEGIQRWQREQDRWPDEWVDAADHSDLQLWLSPGELKALQGELGAVVQRYAERKRSAGDPGAARVAVHLLSYPVRRSVR